MVTENSRWIPPDSPSLCTGREWALVICTFLHCKICTPRMRVCFPQRALGRQNSIFSLEIPSITITSSKPSSGLASGQNLKPPPSYFLVHYSRKPSPAEGLWFVSVKCYRDRGRSKEEKLLQCHHKVDEFTHMETVEKFFCQV